MLLSAANSRIDYFVAKTLTGIDASFISLPVSSIGNWFRAFMLAHSPTPEVLTRNNLKVTINCIATLI
jgi:hypothetical protein